ncbi:MAG: hypothetical protein BWY60_00752 [Actinobacteria bacterium ADurb.Bin346]|nr:MAG: hypothetical protein BWY60_00752 [Actinobacteria bacterium ADurb.Bin346]
MKKIFLENKKSAALSRAVSIIALFISLFIPVLLSSCTGEDATAAALGTATAGFAGIWILLIFVWLIAWGAGIFFFVIWIISLVDCAKRDAMDFPNATDNTKIIWILIIVLAGGIGALIYYIVIMRQSPRKKNLPPAQAS